MAKYGRPEESRREQRTLALELPRTISSTTDPTGDRPPVEVYDITGADDPDLSEMSPITPVDADLEGPIAEFHFSPALEPGEYRVVVYQQRLQADDGKPYELLTDTGRPWTGWNFQVLNASDRHQPSTSGDTETKTDPAPSIDVYLDGQEPGCYGLSGETITVVTGEESAEVELLIKPLLSGIKAPLYMDYVSKTTHTVGGDHAVTFAAVAPIKDYRYDIYHGVDTVGRVPASGGEHVAGVPVMREPVEAQHAPLTSYEKTTVSPQGHPNTYDQVLYTATPQSKAAKPNAYESRRILASGGSLQDKYDTPNTNPRLFSDDVLYREEPVPAEDEKIAALDLPLHSRIAVEVDGQRIWSGQTRLLPVFVDTGRASAELGWTLDHPPAEAEALRKIWRASIEACRLWGCGLPPGPKPPPTVTEFVLTRLANPIDRTAGSQGESRSQIGRQRTAAKSDRAGERRLSALATLLKDCETSLPMRPEDHVPAQSVGYASDASERYPASGDNPADLIAPLYDTDREGLAQHYYSTQYINEHHRMGLPRS